MEAKGYLRRVMADPDAFLRDEDEGVCSEYVEGCDCEGCAYERGTYFEGNYSS